MAIINDSHRVEQCSFIRRKTIAEQFIDEINTVLTIDTNPTVSLDN
jgi:hypothetical protein